MSVVGAGDDVASARYTAVFTADDAPRARAFHATGPVANAAIDAVVQTAMQRSPVRHAALAIVNGSRLVYARGYTLAEPDWPTAQPTTFFRIASDSKTVTAFAAFQLCEADPSQLTIGASVMTNAQPLVPDTMGTIRLATLEGGGGLSGAATDLARLVAIVIAGDDTGALRYATIASMMQAGIAATAAHGDQVRPGYGWDAISYDAAAQQFYAQKGGDLDTDHSCIQLDHDWGFVMLWSASPFAATSWYPNYPDVMTVAKAVSWSTDLFPQFGMASL